MILTRPDGTQETLRLTAQEAMQGQEYLAVALDADDIAAMKSVGWAWFLTFVIPRIVRKPQKLGATPMSFDPKDPTLEYLGDSVYAIFDGCFIVLFIHNGGPPIMENEIYLEPEVLEKLFLYARSPKVQQVHSPEEPIP